ncbi:glutathione S-transferase 1-like [Pieris napi]|uniref:glutathione S-transferase 1-like n=1 Tax=Pieris napi TaxID=78633 RepID=UPI001FBB9CD8|nr:glutathione S-transferase 1-like [Pieris napi]
MVLTLYKCDVSAPARSVLMVIEHLKLPVQFVDVNFMKGEQFTENMSQWFFCKMVLTSTSYIQINPQHTVPTLIDDDFILGDSHAISMYLINKYAKDDSLYPTEPKQRAIVDQRLHFDSGILFPVLKYGFSQVVFQGGKKLTDDAVEKIISAYELTDQFATKSWLAGEQFTVADISCVACISSLNELIPIDAKKYPHLYAWLKRCSELDIYKKKNAPGNNELREVYRSKVAQEIIF